MRCYRRMKSESRTPTSEPWASNMSWKLQRHEDRHKIKMNMDKMDFFLIFWKMTEIYHQNSMDWPIFMEFIPKYLEDDSSIYYQNYIYIYVESMEWFDQNRISAGLDPDAIGIPTICVIIVFIGRYHHDAFSLVRWTTPQSDPKWLYFSLLDYYTWTRNMVATWFDGLRFDVNPRFCWTPSLLLEGTNFNRNSSLCWGVMSIPFVSSVTEQTVQWLKVSAAAGTACKDCMQ
jgi:hypothetical protein